MADSPDNEENFFRPVTGAGTPAQTTSVQSSLLYPRVSTPLPGFPNGQDIDFHCIADDGNVYFCKRDKGPRPIRATEWFCTKLAQEVGVSVAECAVIEGGNGETFFASRSPVTVASEFELLAYIKKAAHNELGGRADWLGQYFASVWALDLFLDNPDRNMRNFVLDKDGSVGRIRAIDFASARLQNLSNGNFPIASEATCTIGRQVRKRHGTYVASAFALLDTVQQVSVSTIRGILEKMPEGWLAEDQMGRITGVWSDGGLEQRITQTKALIEHDWQS